MLEMLRRTCKPKAKWRSRAMLIDLHKTRIVLGVADKPKRMPPWMYRRAQQAQSM